MGLHWMIVTNMFFLLLSNSHNDVSRVAQRYGTMAAHIRRCASVLVVFVVLLRAVQFVGLIRRTPPPHLVTQQSPTPL